MVLAVMLALVSAIVLGSCGCAVSKSTVNIVNSRDITVDASGRLMADGAPVSADAATSATLTLENNQGGGGSGGMLGTIWSYVVSWFGVGK